MDLGLSEEQTMLKDSAVEFLNAELPKTRVRELFESEDGFAPDIWKQMADLGWTGLIIPEEYGGAGADLQTLGVLYEELGAALCPSPHLSSAVLSALTIEGAGSDDQKKNLLPAIAKGEQTLAFAFTEPDYGWGPERVQLSARGEAGNYTLDGTKLFVPDAHIADQILVIGRTQGGQEHGLTAFLVDKGAPGLSIRTQSGWLGDKMNEVTFDGVKASEVIGPVNGIWPVLDKVIDKATGVLSAYMVGGCRTVLEMAVEYSQNRVQFGVPIGTFQRVQDWLIMGVNIEQSARWTTFEGLWKMDAEKEDASQAISMAKVVSSNGYFKAAEAAHHVHGGIGIDLDYGLTWYTQKARTLQHYLGDAVHHRARMARLMDL